MPNKLILASGSKTRRQLLSQARVTFDVENPRVDETAIKNTMIADGAIPRDIAAALADAKARKVSLRCPEALVIGCDQVLAADGMVMNKPSDRENAIQQLDMLAGQTHQLLSAATIYRDGQPQWQFVGTARLTMRKMTVDYLSDYVDRNWQSIQHSVGCYKLEEEGVRLFSGIVGDYFTILGLRLIELLGYLTERGELQG
jgi:septum formation protein